MHGEVAGCIAVVTSNPDTWCDCDAYVSPRDRTEGTAQGVREGNAGADAALHGHAMTYDQTNWRAKAEARMEDLIARGTDFTAEDVTDVVGVAPSPSAIGGLFKGYKARMTAVGYVTASRPEAHGRPLRVWKGKAA
jgi:hypothetical protein